MQFGESKGQVTILGVDTYAKPFHLMKYVLSVKEVSNSS